MPGLKRSDELEKHGVPLVACQLEDGDRVGQRAGDRLVDEHRLACPKDRPRLLEVGPAVDALEQHDVNTGEQLIDRADDGHTEFVAQLLRIARHSIMACGNVGASTRIGRHDADSGQLGFGLRCIQELSKRNHVRGIQPDDAGSQRLRRSIVLRPRPRLQIRRTKTRISSG